MTRLPESLERKLLGFAGALIDQSQARILVPPQRSASGFWFGGGNLTEDPTGALYLVGRYRNEGDSRVGLTAGERGCELAIFRSADRGATFEKVVRFSKEQLGLPGRPVLSIEGSALNWTTEGVELFVSSEKGNVSYPSGLESFLKPGCGVWSIERLAAKTIDELRHAVPKTVFMSRDPEHLHLKDPHVYRAASGDLVLMLCTHPFCWSSSNTAFAVRRSGSPDFEPLRFGLFPRGVAWDVAMTRGTCLLDVPREGAFRRLHATLLFYDGGESLRNLDEHSAAVHRPRGYSCEELGGVAYFLEGDCSRIHRLSRMFPAFVSPFGTGCSRYVDVLSTSDGFHATWQQSQPDLSQPLVIHHLPKAQALSWLLKDENSAEISPRR